MSADIEDYREENRADGKGEEEPIYKGYEVGWGDTG